MFALDLEPSDLDYALHLRSRCGRRRIVPLENAHAVSLASARQRAQKKRSICGTYRVAGVTAGVRTLVTLNSQPPATATPSAAAHLWVLRVWVLVWVSPTARSAHQQQFTHTAHTAEEVVGR